MSETAALEDQSIIINSEAQTKNPHQVNPYVNIFNFYKNGEALNPVIADMTAITMTIKEDDHHRSPREYSHTLEQFLDKESLLVGHEMTAHMYESDSKTVSYQIPGFSSLSTEKRYEILTEMQNVFSRRDAYLGEIVQADQPSQEMISWLKNVLEMNKGSSLEKRRWNFSEARNQALGDMGIQNGPEEAVLRQLASRGDTMSRQVLKELEMRTMMYQEEDSPFKRREESTSATDILNQCSVVIERETQRLVEDYLDLGGTLKKGYSDKDTTALSSKDRANIKLEVDFDIEHSSSNVSLYVGGKDFNLEHDSAGQPIPANLYWFLNKVGKGISEMYTKKIDGGLSQTEINKMYQLKLRLELVQSLTNLRRWLNTDLNHPPKQIQNKSKDQITMQNLLSSSSSTKHFKENYWSQIMDPKQYLGVFQDFTELTQDNAMWALHQYAIWSTLFSGTKFYSERGGYKYGKYGRVEDINQAKHEVLKSLRKGKERINSSLHGLLSGFSSRLSYRHGSGHSQMPMLDVFTDLPKSLLKSQIVIEADPIKYGRQLAEIEDLSTYPDNFPTNSFRAYNLSSTQTFEGIKITTGVPVEVGSEQNGNFFRLHLPHYSKVLNIVISTENKKDKVPNVLVYGKDFSLEYSQGFYRGVLTKSGTSKVNTNGGTLNYQVVIDPIEQVPDAPEKVDFINLDKPEKLQPIAEVLKKAGYSRIATSLENLRQESLNGRKVTTKDIERAIFSGGFYGFANTINAGLEERQLTPVELEEGSPAEQQGLLSVLNDLPKPGKGGEFVGACIEARMLLSAVYQELFSENSNVDLYGASVLPVINLATGVILKPKSVVSQTGHTYVGGESQDNFGQKVRFKHDATPPPTIKSFTQEVKSIAKIFLKGDKDKETKIDRNRIEETEPIAETVVQEIVQEQLTERDKYDRLRQRYGKLTGSESTGDPLPISDTELTFPTFKIPPRGIPAGVFSISRLMRVVGAALYWEPGGLIQIEQEGAYKNLVEQSLHQATETWFKSSEIYNKLIRERQGKLTNQEKELFIQEFGNYDVAYKHFQGIILEIYGILKNHDITNSQLEEILKTAS